MRGVDHTQIKLGQQNQIQDSEVWTSYRARSYTLSSDYRVHDVSSALSKKINETRIGKLKPNLLSDRNAI